MHTIYIRTLKHAEHTVFAVDKGQKTYYDPQFNRSIPYSSGQQIKRSILDSLSSIINEKSSPTTFIFKKNDKEEISEGEVYGTCDPTYQDQLFGGWMKATKNKSERTIKRRSPLSISSMRALHPLLAGVNSENVTFDRSDRSDINKIIVRDENGNELSDDDVLLLLEGKNKSLNRKWIPDQKTATGLFIQDIAIDLRRLFCVALTQFEPEITEDTEKKLRESGWLESENIFGKCLVAPKEEREKLIPAMAKAIIDWKITSNQSRTFSLMETLAVSISDNANKIAASIRAKLNEEDDRRATPIIEEKIEGIDCFVTLPASGYIHTKSESIDALEKAEQKIIDLLTAYNYEKQIKN